MLAHVPILAPRLGAPDRDRGWRRRRARRRGPQASTVERVTIAELDGGVIDFARRHLGELSRGAFDDPRVEIVLGDGADFVGTTDRRFDVIVVDSTDPIGPGAALFTPDFYANCKRVLQPGGVLVTQNGVPFFQSAELQSTMRIFGGLFADATCYLGVVPTFVGGFMAFGWGTDDVGLRTVPPTTLRERFDAARLDTRYYTPELQQGQLRLAAVHRRHRGGCPSGIGLTTWCTTSRHRRGHAVEPERSAETESAWRQLAGAAATYAPSRSSRSQLSDLRSRGGHRCMLRPEVDRGDPTSKHPLVRAVDQQDEEIEPPAGDDGGLGSWSYIREILPGCPSMMISACWLEARRSRQPRGRDVLVDPVIDRYPVRDLGRRGLEVGGQAGLHGIKSVVEEVACLRATG